MKLAGNAERIRLEEDCLVAEPQNLVGTLLVCFGHQQRDPNTLELCLSTFVHLVLLQRLLETCILT